jgi:hypothetical protein
MGAVSRVTSGHFSDLKKIFEPGLVDFGKHKLRLLVVARDCKSNSIALILMTDDRNEGHERRERLNRYFNI